MFLGYKITLPTGGAFPVNGLLKRKRCEPLNQNGTEHTLVTHWLHWCNNASTCPPQGRTHLNNIHSYIHSDGVVLLGD